MAMPPTVSLSPPINWQIEDPHWTHFDNSLNAVSFGFVATAILIFMFLVMAVFERFIRPPPFSSSPGNHHSVPRDCKLPAPPPKLLPVYAREVSVLMPGENFPTFIAQPALSPCPPERIQWSLHRHHLVQGSSSSQITNVT